MATRLEAAASYAMQQINRITSGVSMVLERLEDADNANKPIKSCDAGLYASALLLVNDALGEVYSELATAAKGDE